MDMEKKLQDALNEQIKNELYSAYMYLSMAAYFDSVNLEGFAHWMKVQAKEEYGHAMRLYEHVIDRGAKVILRTIEQPPVGFNSALDVFEKTLRHEGKVTKMIEALYALAGRLNDNAASIMLQWFISEQVEEEKTAASIVETLKMIKDKPQGILMLDSKLGKREQG